MTKAAFEIVLNIHTEDGEKRLDSPQSVRDLIASSIDGDGIEEEIDYTLEVKRINQPLQAGCSPDEYPNYKGKICETP
jgi:hypothetical protein